MKIEQFDQIKLGDCFKDGVNAYFVVDKDYDKMKLRVQPVSLHNIKGVGCPIWLNYTSDIFNQKYEARL